MLPYIFHVSLLITTCYLLYRLLWEKETYFQLNRWILITCLLLSFGLPLLTVPEGWSLQQRVVQQEISPDESAYYPELGTNPLKEVIIDEPISVEVETAVPDGGEVAATNAKEGQTAAIVKERTTDHAWAEWSASLDFWQIIQYVYFGGIIIFLLNFLIQLALIFFQKATNPKLLDGRFTIVEINQDKAPFSFGNSIFINPTKYDWETYDQILDHEKIHIEQRHTLDIIIAELVVIAQWFNPFAWLYRKAVENNLEYLTDFNMLDKGTEPEVYQLNLLRVSVPQLPLNLTTNYNQSFLKKRIAMMNVKKSSASSSWKYLLLLPLLALTVITLNPVQLQSQTVKSLEEKAKKDKEKQEKTSFWDKWNQWSTPPPPAPPAPPSVATPPSPPAPPAPPSPPTPPNGVSSRTTMIGDWTTNSSSQTTVNGEVVMEDKVGIHISGESSFDDDDIVVHRGTVSIDGEVYSFATNGDWSGKFNGDQLCLQLSSDDRVKDYSFSLSFCDRDFGPSVYPDAKGPFNLKRAAGTLTLNGDFRGKRGRGEYTFTEDASYRNYLTSEGYDYVTDNLMLHLYISEVDKSYFAFLKQEGYGNLPKKDLEHLVHHRVREEVLRDYMKAFSKLDLDKPKMSELVQLVIHDISPDYLQEMGGDLFDDLSIQQIVEASIHGVEPDYIREIHQLGYKNMEFRDIIEFAVHGVETDYVKALTAADLGINKQQIIEAAVHGIDTDFVIEATKAGFDNLKFQDIIQFGVHGIDAGYIRDLREVELDNLSPDKIVEAAVHGVNPRTIKAFQDLGIGKNSLSEIIELRVHGVDADYVEGFRDLGYEGLSASKIVEARVHGVNPDDIEAFQDLGLKNIPINKLVEMRVHGVTPSFIDRVQRKNDSKDFSINDYIEMKIHGRSAPARRQE